MKPIFITITNLFAGYTGRKYVQECCNPSWKESRKEGNWKNRYTFRATSTQNHAQEGSFESPELSSNSAPAYHYNLENNN